MLYGKQSSKKLEETKRKSPRREKEKKEDSCGLDEPAQVPGKWRDLVPGDKTFDESP